MPQEHIFFLPTLSDKRVQGLEILMESMLLLFYVENSAIPL